MINLVNEIKKTEDINSDNFMEFIGYPILKEKTTDDEVDRINEILSGEKDLNLKSVGRYYIISKKAKTYIDINYDDKFNDLLNTYKTHEDQVDENISNIYFEMDSRIKEMEAIFQYMSNKIEKLEKTVKDYQEKENMETL